MLNDTSFTTTIIIMSVVIVVIIIINTSIIVICFCHCFSYPYEFVGASSIRSVVNTTSSYSSIITAIKIMKFWSFAAISCASGQ